jgi:hypothetical protein
MRKCGINVKPQETGESERVKKTSKTLRWRVGEFQCSPHHVYVNITESNQLHD